MITQFKSSYIVFSAPSGTGKTTVVNLLLDKYSEMAVSVSATTRKQRNYEIHGKEYYFLSLDDFKNAISENRFLEYEEVHGDYYGTLKDKVDILINLGKTVLFDIDVNGAKSIKKNCPNAILFFLKPPNHEELIRRLKNRNSETEESIQRRLKRLDYEYKQAESFDFIIINKDLNQTIKEIEQIIIKS